MPPDRTEEELRRGLVRGYALAGGLVVLVLVVLPGLAVAVGLALPLAEEEGYDGPPGQGELREAIEDGRVTADPFLQRSDERAFELGYVVRNGTDRAQHVDTGDVTVRDERGRTSGCWGDDTEPVAVVAARTAEEMYGGCRVEGDPSGRYALLYDGVVIGEYSARGWGGR